MKQPVRVIKTEQDYQAALTRLSTLMDEDLLPGSAKESELELWSVLIRHYEQERVPSAKPDAVDAILFRMDQQGLSKKDMAPYLGSASKVSEVLSRKRPLSLSMMRKLHKGLGISAAVLLNGTDQESADLWDEPQFDYARFPWAEMIERGYFEGFSGSVKLAKESAEELIRQFIRGFESYSPTGVRLRAPLFQEGARPMDQYALHVWQIAVLKKARAQRLTATYRPGCITPVWLRELAQLSRFEQGPHLARVMLAEAGIKLVIEPHFKKTYLDGAAMLDQGQPLVALTLRHDRVDSFWFALLYELIHVQRHLSSEHPFIADDLDDKLRSSQEEREADAGAQEALIPAAAWAQASVRTEPTAAHVKTLAQQLRIHPAIVAGRVRRESGNWRILNRLTDTVHRHFKTSAASSAR